MCLCYYIDLRERTACSGTSRPLECLEVNWIRDGEKQALLFRFRMDAKGKSTEVHDVVRSLRVNYSCAVQHGNYICFRTQRSHRSHSQSLGIAKGICYLHSDEIKVAHGDLKTVSKIRFIVLDLIDEKNI